MVEHAAMVSTKAPKSSSKKQSIKTYVKKTVAKKQKTKETSSDSPSHVDVLIKDTMILVDMSLAVVDKAIED